MQCTSELWENEKQHMIDSTTSAVIMHFISQFYEVISVLVSEFRLVTLL